MTMIRGNKLALRPGSSALTGWRGARSPVARITAIVVVAAALVAVRPLAAVGDSAGSPAMQNVTSAPRLPTGARAIGAVPTSATQTAEVVLRPRDGAALTSFIA